MSAILNILIIDDNQDDYELYERLMQKVTSHSYRCEWAHHGEQAMALLKQNPFDCVLIDYSLPGANGLEVLKTINVHYPHLPLIFLTGQGNETVAVEALKCGATDYLSKSFLNKEQLHQTVTHAIQKQSLKNAEPHPATPIILIIDDSPDDREHYYRALKKVPGANYTCLEAEHGNKGIEIASQRHIDCIMLDYSLPGINGLEVLKQLRASQPFLPIILLTGQGNEAVAVEAIKLGAHDYLNKSLVTPERLHQAIKTAISQSALKRDLAKKDQQILGKTAELEQTVAELELAKNEQEILIGKLMESNSDLERFAYACSHDLQEPLRMISNFSERLEKYLGATLDDKARHYMKYITDGASQARQLISDVLNYARVDHETERLVNVESAKTLASVLRDLSARIEETGAHITHDALPEVCIQPTHLRQILQNLVGNALKFCAEKPQLHIGVEQEGMLWRFSVRDNGIGIAPENMQKIFVAFQRLHSRERYPGTGIGLALCKKLVHKYGGRIWVESEVGKGSIFYFTLPPASQQQHQAA